ncbi:MAG: hypothetical protein ABL958_20110 [Bdellovibrionia bacterium]
MNQHFARFAVFFVGALISVSAFAGKGKGHGKHDGHGKQAAVEMLIEDAKFSPMDPKNPNAPEIANANGDLWKGHAWFYMKMKKGESPIHMHSGDYHAVLLKGQSKHWAAEGKTVADAKVMNPGSYWFQPGGQFHGDACLDEAGCMVMIHTDKKFDFAVAPEAKK